MEEINKINKINKVSDHRNGHQSQPKKQARRRVQTNKPYQERLMNMAEARREIVTALKFHRASMKQQQSPSSNQTNHCLVDQEKSISDRYPPPATASYASYWHVPPIAPLVMNEQNFGLVLPNQPLGLNLNYKHFNNLNTSIYYNPAASSSASSAGEEVAVANGANRARRSDRCEMGGEEVGKKLRVDCFEDEGDGICSHDPFEQVSEFIPPWLINANENSSLEDMFDYHLCHEYSPDPALPCMDIGEIEGIDGDWLA